MTLLRRLLDAQRKRRARQDLKGFDALIASPGNLATGIVLPANGVFFLSNSTLRAVTTVVMTVNPDRTIGIPASAANTYSPAGWLAAGKTVAKAVGAPGTVRLYVQDDLGTLYLIAEG